MNTVLVSPEFQVEIPLEICQSLNIQAGQRVQIIQHDNRVELIPLRPIRQARGMLRGIETDVARGEDRI